MLKRKRAGNRWRRHRLALLLALIGSGAIAGLLALSAGAAVGRSDGKPVRRSASAAVIRQQGRLAADGRLGKRTRISATDGSRVRLQGETVPALSRLIGLGRLHAVGTTRRELRQPITVTITLRRSNERGFRRFLAAVTNPRSPDYRHFLTQAQLTRRFGPTLREYRRIRSWLSSNGFTRLEGSANHLTLTATGTQTQADRAFGVTIHEYRVGSRIVYANTADPIVPSFVAQDVQSIDGLSDLARPATPPQWVTVAQLVSCGVVTFNVWAPFAAFFAPLALPAAVVASFACLAGTDWALYSPADAPTPVPSQGSGGGQGQGQFGSWKNGTEYAPAPPLRPRASRSSPSRSGTAQSSSDPPKLGLLEYDTFNQSDVVGWIAATYGAPSQINRLSEVPVNGGVASAGGGESEVLLDIDTALLLTAGTGTSVVVYDAPLGTSFAQVFNAMIGDGDTVISNSWAQCEDQTPVSQVQAIDSVLQQAEAGGVSVLNATGDTGSTCLDGSPGTVAVPADSPNATAVGGTSFTPGPGGTYGKERWWDGVASQPQTGQGGFGVSKDFSHPSYQNGFSTAAGRSVPDVAAPADPTGGMEICEADAGGCPTGLRFGGTSAAAPEWAATAADLSYELGHRVGSLNSVLYPLANSPALHDAASMSSDFAHVGLGDANYGPLLLALENRSVGAVSAIQSGVLGIGGVTSPSSLASPNTVPADGATHGIVRVDLSDANGFPVPGKSVSLTANSGCHAQVSAPSGPSDTASGAVVFTVTDTTIETCTFTATDTTDNVTLNQAPTLSFIPPQATGGVISANPTTVKNDGTSDTTISVYLQNSLGRPASGKTVSLSYGSGPTVTPVGSSPGPNEAVTDATGVAKFTATDTNQQTVDFTANDVTDGNVPVPGSAEVTFEPGGSSSCSDATPTAVSGYSISTWASGLAYNPQALSGPGNFTLEPCSGINAAKFDSSGNAYVPDAVSGEIYRLPATGGAVTQSDALPDTPNYSGGDPTGIAFGNQGDLFVAHVGPQIDELDSSTGQFKRVVGSGGGGDHFCGWGMATDPLSGDIFHTDLCFGSVASGEVTRLSGPEGASPSWTDYANTGGSPVGDLAFAPDGTMYVAVNGSNSIVSVTGTNGPSTPTVSTVATLPNAPAGVAVASSDSSGHATSLYAAGSGSIYRIDLTQSPATVQTIASGGSSSIGWTTVGPDGCLYVSDLDRILKVSGPGCSSAAATPEIDLSQTTGSSTPTTGSAVGFTATLQNFPVAAGAPVHFSITGPNMQAELVNAGSSGTASMSYAGVFQGIDAVTAWAEVNGKVVTSAPIEVHWMPGKDTSFLSLNGSPETAPLGQPVRLVANLSDVTNEPAAPISGAQVTISVGGQSCTATSDGSGDASCSVTPGGSQALETVTASYAGDGTHTPATASNVFEWGGVGTLYAPQSTGAPQITGTPLPGDRLTCSPGSWSNLPTAFAYQWNRDGRPIGGATGNTYVVQILDEAQTLTCTVTASNAAGSGQSTSPGVLVALPGTLSCPKPKGGISGLRLGQIALGMKRKRAHRALRRYHVTHGFDVFCLYAGWGIRTGYPSARLLRAQPRAQRSKLAGRVIIALTGNPFFALNGVTPGMSSTFAKKQLHLRKPFHITNNLWYLIPRRKVTWVVKVSGGIVQEVGLVEKQLSRTRREQKSLLGSWGRLPWGRQPP